MSTSSRDALARGDVTAWIESMGPDEQESFHVDLSPLGEIQGSFARIGQTLIMVAGDGTVIMNQAPSQEQARAVYNTRVITMRADVARLEASKAGGPDSMVDGIMSFLGQEPAPTGRVPAEVPTANLSTGLYI